MSEQAGWPFEIEIKVIFRDMDAMGHVNNAVYFTYMETARTSFFAERLSMTEPRRLPVIVAEASCTYLAPLRMGDIVTVQLGVSRIGRRSFDLSYLLTSAAEEPVARAKTVMVTFDYESASSIPIPKSLRAALEAALAPGATHL